MSEYMSVGIIASFLASSSQNKLAVATSCREVPNKEQSEDMPGADMCHMGILKNFGDQTGGAPTTCRDGSSNQPPEKTLTKWGGLGKHGRLIGG